MSKLVQFSALLMLVAITTAATPRLVAAGPAVTVLPAAIIEGGTVSTLPKSVKSRRGKVVVLRSPRNKAAARATRKSAAVPAAARATEKELSREAAIVSAGGSSADMVDLRSSENGLRVMMIGPDGLTRTRLVPAAPGLTARPSQDE